ncbi:GTP-binding protein rho4 [Trichonephila clavata]|uniref:GTP-binding protein rho4 n=1 Tax=Trichonephila clavata TaxID=2740835 RepID=A0A8X6IJU6_TRICU|nr:GTP-binding protein rho4 [Trichonephila clavata]
MFPGRKRMTSGAMGDISEAKVMKLGPQEGKESGPKVFRSKAKILKSGAPVDSYVHIVVVGSSKCGKTCLIKSFKGEPWPPTSNYRSTPCLADVRFLGGSKKSMIWDMDARPDFLEARREAYEETDIILLCFDIRGESTLSEQTEQWLQEIKTHRPHTPIMLVGLKQETRYDRSLQGQITEVEANQLKIDRGLEAYMEASAFHRSGVVEIFEAAVGITVGNGLCNKVMWRDRGFRLPLAFTGGFL